MWQDRLHPCAVFTATSEGFAPYYLARIRHDLRQTAVLSRDVPLYISAITELELFGYPRITEEEIARIEELLKSMVIIPVDSRVARIAGAVRRQYRLKTADSAVAGTALLTHSTLVTRNMRDFQNVPALSLLSV